MGLVLKNAVLILFIVTVNKIKTVIYCIMITQTKLITEFLLYSLVQYVVVILEFTISVTLLG